ncbi:hypothetical protein VNO80_04399 [Phaseolus coccineus]|uniref:Secreted protein n=1 Tax=Phaseolus coccineus TaxID=3886 RepID=A0AAN9RRW1_PHACN
MFLFVLDIFVRFACTRAFYLSRIPKSYIVSVYSFWYQDYQFWKFLGYPSTRNATAIVGFSESDLNPCLYVFSEF